MTGIFGATRRSISNAVYPYAQWFALIMIFGLPWSHAFFYIGFVGLLFCILFSTDHYGDVVKTLKVPVVFWALILFSWIAIGVIYTSAPLDMAIFDLKKYRKLLLLPLLLLIFQDLRSAKKLALAYCAGVVVLLSFTLIDGFHINKFLNFDISGYKDNSYVDTSLVYWRNHIVHGFHVSILFVISFTIGLLSKRFRLLYFLLSLVCLYDILFLINGRAALLGLIFSIFFLANYYSKSIRYYIATIVVLFICICLAFFMSDKLQQQVISVTNEANSYYEENNFTTSGGIRLYYWSKSYEIFQTAPIVGVGPGSFRQRMLQPDILITNFNQHHAHNEYITLLSQHGIIGLLIFSTFVISIYRSAKSHPNQWLGKIVIISLVIFLINALTDSSLHNESEGWTLLLLACIANTCERPRLKSGLQSKFCFNRWLTCIAIRMLKQPLTKSVPAVKALNYIVETGTVPIIRRVLQRKAIFWFSGQESVKKISIKESWKKGIFIYFGENQIGDALMDLAPRSLLIQSGLSIDLFTTPKIAELFKNDPWFTLVEADYTLLDHVKYDFAIVLNNKRRPLAPKIKYFKNLPWVSIHEGYFGPSFHRSRFVAQRFADLLGLKLSMNELYAASTQKLVELNGLNKSTDNTDRLTTNPLVICIGGVDVSRTYFKWTSVIELLLKKGELPLVLLGNDNGADYAAELISKFSHQTTIKNLVGKTTLLQARHAMLSCSLVVCADGGLMHIAATTNTPLLALFSNVIQSSWRLESSTLHESISSATLNINDISPELIVAAVNRWLRIVDSSPTK